MKTRQITYTALFVAFAIICAFLTRFMSSMLVPFSFLPFISVLAGAVLGKKLGAYAMSLYVCIGLIGLPVFATAPFGGLAYVLHPTFGFILGFIAAAYISGWVLEKRKTNSRYIMATLLGIVALYLVALPYFSIIINLYLGQSMDPITVIKTAFLPFILLDILKAIAAAVLAKTLLSRLPGLKEIHQPPTHSGF